MHQELPPHICKTSGGRRAIWGRVKLAPGGSIGNFNVRHRKFIEDANFAGPLLLYSPYLNLQLQIAVYRNSSIQIFIETRTHHRSKALI
jgi:hypothetical protein